MSHYEKWRSRRQPSPKVYSCPHCDFSGDLDAVWRHIDQHPIWARQRRKLPVDDEGQAACAAFEDLITKNALPGEDRDATAERLLLPLIEDTPDRSGEADKTGTGLAEGGDVKQAPSR